MDRKGKRCYGRIMSGLTRALSQGYKVRRHKYEDITMLSNKSKYLCFLTLTTRYDRLFNVIYGISGVPKKSLKRLTDNFQKLVRMIRRKYGKFDYIRVRTQEGGGVLHILFKG